MNTYPASEQSISEVERGRSSQAIVPMAEGKTVAPGDLVLFALATSQSGQGDSYVKDGDSVCVLLTDVTDLGTTDPATGMRPVSTLLETARSTGITRVHLQACR